MTNVVYHMFEFLYLFVNLICCFNNRMDLSNPECWAHKRRDGHGVFACFTDVEPPGIRRYGDDESDADVDIDLSDEDVEAWESR